MSFVVFNSSAGSGKTFTLVKEYLILTLSVNEYIPFRQILAMTFTNKAAAEMKTRVLQVLVSIMNGEPNHMGEIVKEHLQLSDEQLRIRCEKLFFQMLHHYSDFNIGTIDKFMYKVIRTFARDLRLPLNFDVELEEDQLVTHAVSQLLNQVGQDELLTTVLLKFSMEKYEDGKSWSLDLDLRKMASMLLKDIPQSFLTFLEGVDANRMHDTFQEIRKEYFQQKKQIQSIGRTYFQKLEENHLSPEDMAGGKNGVSKYFEYALKGLDEKWIPSNRVAKNVAENKWSATKTEAFKKNTIIQIQSDLEELFLQIQEFVENQYGDYLLKKLALSKMYQLILFNEIQDKLSLFKAENSVVHISDFNKSISKIVTSEPAPFIFERLGEKYKHYLIDEFQDTSILQWQNILPLVENSLASGNEVILVGDGKQAIYRWRGGEVEQFSLLPCIHPEIQDQFSQERAALLESFYQPEKLDVNYRSSKDVVHFNNELYTHIASYLPEHLQQIYDGLKQTPSNQNQGFIDVRFFNADTHEDYDNWNLHHVHQQIELSLDKGFLLSDIAILCVKRSETVSVAQFLVERGIQIVSEESLLVQNDASVNQLLLLLTILNAKDKSSLSSSIYQLLELLYEMNKDASHPVDLYQKFEDDTLLFEDWIETVYEGMNWSFLYDKPIMEILEHFIRICRLDSTSAALLAFLDVVFSYIRKHGENLNGLLTWWKDNGDKISIAMPEGLDAVRIMTIHKSKGLEFPVVIFPFISNRARVTKNELWTSIENDILHGLPIALLPMNKQLLHTQVSHLYQLEIHRSLLDRLNLLYVATTRAIDRLILISDAGNQKDDMAMADMLYSFCQSSTAMNSMNDGFVMGLDKIKSNETSEITPHVELKGITTKSWRSKLMISVHSKFEQELTKQEDPRQFGILLHHLMSKFRSQDDVNSELMRLVESGEIGDEEMRALRTHAENIFKMERQVIEGNVIHQWSERELLSNTGKIYRPDKVVETDKGYILIDYKSGEMKPEHTSQLKEYAEALQQMSHKIHAKYLIYSGLGKLTKV